MFLKVLVTCLLPCIVLCNENETTPAPANITGPPNEMYVIHATHYEVGILTNNTDLLNATNSGVQEAITIFKSNGSTLNLANITAPLFSNVTGDAVVGVAPILSKDKNTTLPWLFQTSVAPNESTPDPNNGTAASEISLKKPLPKLSTMELESKKLAVLGTPQ